MIRNKRQLVIVDPTSQRRDEHNNIPLNKHLMVSRGDRVRKGQKLTVGSIVPQKLLEVSGVSDLQRHLVNEIQLVYRTQGVEINDKHVEIIIRQMMQKVKITDPGNTEFLPGEQLDRGEFERINRQLIDSGKQPAVAEPVLLGITKAALETESFISAASFQDTTRILTEAATVGKVDVLTGFKENVITGHLIPAGTGTERLQSIELRYLGEEIEQEMPEQSDADLTAGETPQWRDKASDDEDDFGIDDEEIYEEQEQVFEAIEDDFGEDSFGEEETFDDENL